MLVLLRTLDVSAGASAIIGVRYGVLRWCVDNVMVPVDRGEDVDREAWLW